MIPAASPVGYRFVIVMATPSTVTDAFEAKFEASCSAFVKVAAELTAARNPFKDAARAWEVTSMNFGAAMAARMPRIRITTISSTSVKPRVCFFILVSLTNLVTYRLNLTPDTLYTSFAEAFHPQMNPGAIRRIPSSVSLELAFLILVPIASKTKYRASPARLASRSSACARNPIPPARRPAPESEGACFRPPGAQGARRDREHTPAPSWSHRNTSSLAAHRAAVRGIRLGSPEAAPSATRLDWHAQAIRYFLLRPAGAWPRPAAAARFSPRRRYIPRPPFRRPPGKSAAARTGARRTAR